MARLDYINLLPQELLSDVFSRLPAKSLGQCKCVSKSWKAFISEPGLIQTHLTRTSITKLILTSVLSDPGALYSADFVQGGRFNYKNPNCKVARMEPKGETKKKLNFNLSNGWFRVWGSCDGLVLVQANGNQQSMFVLNPTTLEARKLPLLPRHFYCNMFGFGYDSSCDDYAVVAISYVHGDNAGVIVRVFMLKGNQWKKVGFSPFDHKDQKVVGGIFLKGSLHWFIKKSLIIGAYNIAEKKFSGVPLPVGVFDSSSEFPRLGVLKGCLCLFSDMINCISEMYVMQEYGVVESWTKLSVVLCDVSNIASLNLLEDSSGSLESGRSILLVSSAEKATGANMKVLGLPYDFQVGMTFIESLVSPYKDGSKKTTGRKSKTIPAPRQDKDDISGWLKAW